MNSCPILFDVSKICVRLTFGVRDNAADGQTEVMVVDAKIITIIYHIGLISSRRSSTLYGVMRRSW